MKPITKIICWVVQDAICNGSFELHVTVWGCVKMWITAISQWQVSDHKSYNFFGNLASQQQSSQQTLVLGVMGRHLHRLSNLEKYSGYYCLSLNFFSGFDNAKLGRKSEQDLTSGGTLFSPRPPNWLKYCKKQWPMQPCWGFPTLVSWTDLYEPKQQFSLAVDEQLINSESSQRLIPSFWALPPEVAVLFDWNLSRCPLLRQVDSDLLLCTGFNLEYADTFLATYEWSKDWGKQWALLGQDTRFREFHRKFLSHENRCDPAWPEIYKPLKHLWLLNSELQRVALLSPQGSL